MFSAATYFILFLPHFFRVSLSLLGYQKYRCLIFLRFIIRPTLATPAPLDSVPQRTQRKTKKHKAHRNEGKTEEKRFADLTCGKVVQLLQKKGIFERLQT